MLQQKQSSMYPSAKTVKLLFNQIQTAFVNEESQKLSKLLKTIYTDPAYNNADKWKVSIASVEYNSGIGSAFLRVLENIKLFQTEKLKRGVNFAFKLHLDVLSSVLKLLDEIRDSGWIWICKPLRQIMRATKKIFLAATKREMETGGAVKVKKDDLIIKMQEFKARKSLGDEVKRQIIPLVDNLQVSMLLVYHNYDQVSGILHSASMYGQQGPAFIDNYNFQRAKTAMIYQQFLEAEQYFQKINIRTVGQKRLVLKYLIPCKMFLGKNFVPNPKNPEENFPEYDPIIKALNRAKFSDYQQAIKKYQKLWIKRGIYLLMDKLRVILWRNLLKKVQKVIGDYKIDIQKIHKAVQLSGGEEKVQECICIISNLIYEGKIKGYIYQNQQQKVLVLKKGGEGFPSLSK